MKKILSQSIFFGGAPCSGKSTLAERLSRDLGMPYYKCDDHFMRHMDEAAAAGLPYATKVKSVTHEYIFMRSDSENVDFGMNAHGEEFEYILKDIMQYDQPVVAEGVSLLPAQVAAVDIPKENAFYLVPTEDFHREKYKERTWAWDRLEETSDPEQAYENWMRRDAIMARLIYEEAIARGFHAWQVDHSTVFEDLYADMLQAARRIVSDLMDKE
jgi:2-phosphoglycerate kinase